AMAMLGLSSAHADEAAPPALVGRALPPAELFDLEGRRLRTQDLREPVLVLNFFAFWCDTWIAELPQLRELSAEQADLGFRLLSISVDGKWTDQLHVVCGDDPPPWPVLIDRGSRLSRKLGLRRIPTLLVLNRERGISAVFEAHPGNTALRQAIRAAGSAGARPSGPHDG
ncbi:MAG: TlpA family protein disulfide reductase, partial [Armatimonadetes bacterium]|nr:TlpA family protein disulfide reductase [Armatimonadota bacterium]